MMASLSLHDSRCPSTASVRDEQLKVVIPGERLLPLGEGVRCGSGTYEMHGHVCASLLGFLHLVSAANDQTTTVEVRRHRDRKHHIVPFVGAVVTARVRPIVVWHDFNVQVLNIGARFAQCEIACVENTRLSHAFNATLRREDVRATERDKISLYECVRPGDVILARVINFGDTQTSFLLSTAEDELGVVSAVGESGQRMVPASWTTVRSLEGSGIEPRKVAQVPNLNL